MEEIQSPTDEANETVNYICGIWSVNHEDSTETEVETEQTGTTADSLHRYFMAEKRKLENTDSKGTELQNKSLEVENIAFLRKWLVVPITILYFGAFITSFLTIQQYVYVKLQRDKYPNETFNSSVPVCKANESDPKYKIQAEVQKESAQWMTYLALASGIPGFFLRSRSRFVYRQIWTEVFVLSPLYRGVRSHCCEHHWYLH